VEKLKGKAEARLERAVRVRMVVFMVGEVIRAERCKVLVLFSVLLRKLRAMSFAAGWTRFISSWEELRHEMLG
jgi:hypothetical protein